MRVGEPFGLLDRQRVNPLRKTHAEIAREFLAAVGEDALGQHGFLGKMVQ
jgi:hypothetical protein